MAFGFFRRRQKLVLIIMVILMVAFLIPTSIESFGRRSEGDTVVGRAGQEDITIGMVWSAERDLKVLTDALAIGSGQVFREGEGAYAMFRRINAREAVHAWTLLVHEAKALGLGVTDQDVADFLAASGWVGDQYRQQVANLHAANLSERDLRRGVANHLRVSRAFDAARVGGPPTLPQIRLLYRDLRERIDLAMVEFPAQEFSAGAAEPAEAEIRQWFETRKHLLPDGPTNRTPFGFGYRQPERADIAWIMVYQDRLAPAVTVPDAQARAYWLSHRGELTKEVPLAPTTTPATGPATGPATWHNRAPGGKR